MSTTSTAPAPATTVAVRLTGLARVDTGRTGTGSGRTDTGSGRADTGSGGLDTAPGRLDVVPVAAPEPGPGEVLVRVTAVGLCGTDLAVRSGARPVPELPWTVGHEGGGRVVAVGAGVDPGRVGEIVVVEPNLACGRCRFCVAGRTSACPDRRSLGVNAPGLLAGLVAVPAGYAHALPAGLDPATAERVVACVEPWVVTRAALRRAAPEPGSRCLVVGAGSQGTLLCLSLLAAGHVPVVAEPHDGRRRRAVDLGAEELVPGEVFGTVFETSGAPAAWPTAVAAVDRAGTLLLIGQHDGESPVNTHDLVQRQVTVTGSLIYDHPGDFAGALADLPAVADALVGLMEPEPFAPDRAAAAFDAVATADRKVWLAP
ncbi:alcohol dehydrogenase catalytic domain-containing protein [Pseudonocardia sp. Ae505_Ps2]|uniref:zinc-dependent alcohol dehydrogenase n=1 Tax=Pseudonocardia sp. Ae505_Ps2 TaxID=1885034 RepID=UPI0009608468|nr:alcohol dehydrogenase catalytic domain-containing protein [Pseudonocardia sp. Ae505_Ps2]OLM10483.1 Sorbitol dehydrogenase [Pseudonocardia sp. Ae505_Ps2]